MEERTFTLSEIEKAILQCPSHKVHIDKSSFIDDSFDKDIETIETEMFLFRLFKSDINDYQKYKNLKH